MPKFEDGVYTYTYKGKKYRIKMKKLADAVLLSYEGVALCGCRTDMDGGCSEHGLPGWMELLDKGF